MKLHRFFIEEQLRNKKEITLREDDLIHQLKDVFRLHAGDKLVLLDNSGLEFLAEVVSLSKNGAEMKIIESAAAANIPQQEVWLFASLIKKDNFEWIVEKGTEIGISHFVPIISDRSEKKRLNMERAEKIIQEASEQSGRGTLPEIHEMMDMRAALDLAREKNVSLLAFHTEGEKLGEKFHSMLPGEKNSVHSRLGIPPEPVGVLIGPEGGWSEREIELFTSKNIPMYSLGPQILRAETAAIVVAALIIFSR